MAQIEDDVTEGWDPSTDIDQHINTVTSYSATIVEELENAVNWCNDIIRNPQEFDEDYV